MKTKNKIFESDEKSKGPIILVPDEDLPKTIDKYKGKDVKLMTIEGNIVENNIDVIEPKDPETIKYLSNVVDSKTGEISKPFTISGKQ
jgi:hypothetical protein